MDTLSRAACRAELLTRLERLRPDIGRRWGRMSAHQMVCHLSDAYRMAMGQKAGRDISTQLTRTLLKWMALYLPLPWPREVQTVPEIQQGLGGTCPADFASDVADLIGLMQTFASRELHVDWPPHPIFGPLSTHEWMRWGYLHVDHHLRQFGL